jgi:hypothetical protein
MSSIALNVRRRRGQRTWPRRAATLGAAVAVLGAVLTATNTANAAPTISLSKPCGASETTLTVSGAGLAPAQAGLYVYAHRQNGDYVTAAPVRVDAGGRYSVTIGFDVGQRGQDPAAPAVHITLYGRGGQLASTWYFVGCARLDVSPRYTQQRGGALPLTVDFREFAPDTPAQLTVAGLPPAAPVLPRAGITFTLDRVPGCGQNAITARQKTIDRKIPTPLPDVDFAPSAPRLRAALAPIPGAPDRVATSSIFVFCPRLAAQPNTFGDTALPGVTTVSGDDWLPSSARMPIPVRLSLDGANIGGDIHPDPKTRRFAARVTLPRSRCGTHRLTAVQTYQPPNDPSLRAAAMAAEPLVLSAETTVTVKCAQAQLTLTPTVTEAGRTIEAAGAGFVAGRSVKLEWVNLENLPIGDAGTVTAGPDGKFTFGTLILPNSDLGTRRLHALDLPAAGDLSGAREGFADLLLVPGSMERGRTRFLERR